jgi:hypothetical protein
LKRLLSIFFLSIFLFSLIGYYAVYLGLRSQANNELKKKLDSNSYDESEMLSMKIPFTLPYQTDWHGFQRVDGDFERGGEFYNLVKQKVERDTLIIYYIKDHHEADLFESLTGFVHASTDTPMSKSAGKIIENFSIDYLFTCSELEHLSAGWSLETPFGELSPDVISLHLQVLSPPPDSRA